MTTPTPRFDGPYQATPAAGLREQIMDSRIPKNEREWWASHHIEKIERELAAANARAERAEAERDALAAAMPSEGADAALAYAAMKTERDAALKDAERLDWLEKNPRHAQIIIDGEVRECVFYGISCHELVRLRDAIDVCSPPAKE